LVNSNIKYWRFVATWIPSKSASKIIATPISIILNIYTKITFARKIDVHMMKIDEKFHAMQSI
jgi:hypothetical protein